MCEGSSPACSAFADIGQEMKHETGNHTGKYGGINEYVLAESSVESQLLYLALVYMQ